MSGLLYNIAIGVCMLYVLVLFLCTNKDKKCKYQLDDDKIFDSMIANLDNQLLQHMDIQTTMTHLKEKFQKLTLENELLRKEIQKLEIEQREETKTVDEVIKEDDFIPGNEQTLESDSEPSMEQEMLQKRIKNDAVELMYSFESLIKSIESSNEKDEVIKTAREQQIGMLVDIEKLINFTEDWRKKEAKSLQDLVQNRITYAQNPPSCSNARKLICMLNKRCGFGCQIHHASYCLMIAFGTGRTLILRSKGWVFDPEGWEKVFLPLSETCTKTSSWLPAVWKVGGTDGATEVLLPAADGLKDPPPYIPLSVPQDIAPRLKRLHGNPGAWWVGQFVKYLFRSQDWLETELKQYEYEVGFNKPIVGVHIRRTDKLMKEAQLHEVEEYMRHVDAWYDKYDLTYHRNTSEKAHRRVYLATDEPAVVDEAIKKYPKYEFVNFASFAKSAVDPHKRNTRTSLIGIAADIYLLSRCNYLSCTFSSQVCRTAYELMQTYHPDASDYFHSLDDIYYFGGMSAHNQKAVYDHFPEPDSGEIELRVGDIVGVAGNHWNGFSKGFNRRTEQEGFYPSWKVEEIIGEVKYPKYPGANKT